MERADKLVDRLISQRNMFLEAFLKTIYSTCPTHGIEIPFHITRKKKDAAEIISAFQTVHVLSFIASKNYLDPKDVGEFTRYVASYLYEGDHDTCIKYTKRYTSLKTSETVEQLLRFCEDIINAILGRPSGILLGPGFIFTAKEFFYRNWGIAADTFGDSDVVNDVANIIKSIHSADGKD